jgi:diguanylate cyclase (GGDEF)-like protein
MTTNTLSKKQVIVRIVAFIAIAEFIVMLVLGLIPVTLTLYAEAILDIVLLALLSTPLIYFWVVSPFVSARDEALAHINKLAHTDPLTDLPNRRLLVKYFEKFMTSTVRHNSQGALLLIDLDGFKSLNDQFGHDAGDHVLIEISKRIKSVTREEDVAARLGGDEFVVLIHHLDRNEQKIDKIALHIGKKLVDLVRQPIQFNDKTLHVGASVGVRLLASEALDLDAAIKDADIAMYQAKESGKGRVVFFE